MDGDSGRSGALHRQGRIVGTTRVAAYAAPAARHARPEALKHILIGFRLVRED